jgi:hypothetical protein
MKALRLKPGASAVQRHVTEKSFAQFSAGSCTQGGAPGAHWLFSQLQTWKVHGSVPLQYKPTLVDMSPFSEALQFKP